MINVMNRDGLISTSGTSDLSRLLQEQQMQSEGLVPRDMSLFTQRFDQTAPIETTGIAPVYNNNLTNQIVTTSKDIVKNKIFNKLTNFKPPSLMMFEAIMPERDPRVDQTREYYDKAYGLDDIGRIQEGQLMAGYSPISGGGLYTLTGGKFGSPPTLGLNKAYQKRIDTIVNKGIPRLEKAGKALKVKRLEKLKQLQALDNAAIQGINLANATAIQKGTMRDFQKGKMDTVSAMPAQQDAARVNIQRTTTGGAGISGNQSTGTSAERGAALHG